MAYVTVCPTCGAWCGRVPDLPGQGAETMRCVADWLRVGWTVKRVLAAEAEVGLQPCRCQPAQQLRLLNN